jgi:hypothetical protein
MKRIGKLHLHKETVRRLDGAPPAAFSLTETQNICPSISYCLACATGNTSCLTAC